MRSQQGANMDQENKEVVYVKTRKVLIKPTTINLKML